VLVMVSLLASAICCLFLWALFRDSKLVL